MPADGEALAMLLNRHVFARALHELEGWIGGVKDPIDVPLADILRMLER